MTRFVHGLALVSVLHQCQGKSASFSVDTSHHDARSCHTTYDLGLGVDGT